MGTLIVALSARRQVAAHPQQQDALITGVDDSRDELVDELTTSDFHFERSVTSRMMISVDIDGPGQQ